MWTYRQSTGELIGAAGEIVAAGYSGRGDGRNNPLAQSVHDAGPIPQGSYAILPPRDTQTHGSFVMPLSPAPTDEMFGRAGFLIHGDNVNHDASLGCIILPRDVRERIWISYDHSLQVVA